MRDKIRELVQKKSGPAEDNHQQEEERESMGFEGRNENQTSEVDKNALLEQLEQLKRDNQKG